MGLRNSTEFSYLLQQTSTTIILHLMIMLVVSASASTQSHSLNDHACVGDSQRRLNKVAATTIMHGVSFIIVDFDADTTGTVKKTIQRRHHLTRETRKFFSK